MGDQEAPVTFHEWIASIADTLKTDPLWKVQVYRMALFVAEIGWADVTLLSRDRRTQSLSDQLYRSLGGISACIAEGYSRGTGKDRARFYEYALGSAGKHVTGTTRAGTCSGKREAPNGSSCYPESAGCYCP